jgi:hypothetical protein
MYRQAVQNYNQRVFFEHGEEFTKITRLTSIRSLPHGRQDQIGQITVPLLWISD